MSGPRISERLIDRVSLFLGNSDRHHVRQRVSVVTSGGFPEHDSALACESAASAGAITKNDLL